MAGRKTCLVYVSDPSVRGGGADLRAMHLAHGLRSSGVSFSELQTSRCGPVVKLVRRVLALLLGIPPRYAQLYSPALRRQINSLVEDSDLPIVTMIFTAAMVRRDLLPKIIYDAHNVESDVIRHMARGDFSLPRRLAYRLTLRWSERFEQRLVGSSRAVWAVSDDDATWFRAAGAREVMTVPNGVAVPLDVERVAQTDQPATKLLFVGSLQALFNREGVQWFINEVLPGICEEIPGTTLTLVGAGGEAFSGVHVEALGFIDDLRPIYAEAEIAIVPLLSGAGTRLKIVEAMAWGLPVISTPIGCAGLEVRDQEHLSVVEPDDARAFGEALVSLMTDASLRKEFARNATRLVHQRYDWAVIVEKAARHLEELGAHVPTSSGSRRRWS